MLFTVTSNIWHSAFSRGSTPFEGCNPLMRGIVWCIPSQRGLKAPLGPPPQHCNAGMARGQSAAAVKGFRERQQPGYSAHLVATAQVLSLRGSNAASQTVFQR